MILKVKLDKTEYEVKYKLRALVIYEQISGSDYKVGGLMDSIILLYSFILANNPEFSMTPDDFMDALDETPLILNKFNDWLLQEQKQQQLLASEENKKKTPKSKKKV